MPLAMAALPLYVHLPEILRRPSRHRSRRARRAAAGAAPRSTACSTRCSASWSDRARSRKVLIACAAPVLALGMIALFMPLPRAHAPLLVWLGVALALVYVAFSLATINHNAWGAELSADPVERTRITAVREGLALCGVVIAARAADAVVGWRRRNGLGRSALVFAAFTPVCAAVMLRGHAARACRRACAGSSPGSGLRAPLGDPLFRRLLVVFLANGIASAIPATLVLFFIADVLARNRARASSSRCTSSPAPPGCRCGSSSPRASARCARGRGDGRRRSSRSSGRGGSGPATRARSRSSACCRGWRSAPISRCRRRCSPTSSAGADAWTGSRQLLRRVDARDQAQPRARRRHRAAAARALGYGPAGATRRR